MKKINYMDQFQKRNHRLSSKQKFKVKSDDILIKNQIKSIGEHFIQISPYRRDK